MKWRAPLILILPVVILLTIAVGVSAGSAFIALGDIIQILGKRLGLNDFPDGPASIIVWELRLPRVLLAGIVGGGLAVVGVAMQALVRNPLAEPYILGVSSGASAGASLFYLGWIPAVVSSHLSIGLAGFLGALGAMTAVYLIAKDGPRTSTARLLLAGVALQAMLGALVSFLIFAAPQPQKLQMMMFLLLGTFSGTGWLDLILPLMVTGVGTGILWLLARPMDALLTGEEPAAGLGVSVETVKRTLIALSAVVTGVLVAAAGIIGFVGLIIPHAVRFISGVGHRRLIPLCFFVGAVFLMWADLAARTILPSQELPVGVLTALCGVPFFLILLRKAGPKG